LLSQARGQMEFSFLGIQFKENIDRRNGSFGQNDYIGAMFLGRACNYSGERFLGDVPKEKFGTGHLSGEPFTADRSTMHPLAKASC